MKAASKACGTAVTADGSTVLTYKISVPEIRFGCFALGGWSLRYIDTESTDETHNLIGMDTLKYFRFLLHPIYTEQELRDFDDTKPYDFILTALPDHMVEREENDIGRQVCSIV